MTGEKTGPLNRLEPHPSCGQGWEAWMYRGMMMAMSSNPTLWPRRRFLQALGAATAAVAAAPACSPVPTELQPDGSVKLQVLSQRQYAVMNALALTVLGPKAAKHIQAGAADPARRLDQLLAISEPHAKKMIPVLLNVIEFAPWPLMPKLRTFTHLSPEARLRVLEAMKVSDMDTRQAILASARAMVGQCYYLYSSSWADIRYHGKAGEDPEGHAYAMTYAWDTEPPAPPEGALR